MNQQLNIKKMVQQWVNYLTYKYYKFAIYNNIKNMDVKIKINQYDMKDKGFVQLLVEHLNKHILPDTSYLYQNSYIQKQNCLYIFVVTGLAWYKLRVFVYFTNYIHNLKNQNVVISIVNSNKQYKVYLIENLTESFVLKSLALSKIDKLKQLISNGEQYYKNAHGYKNIPCMDTLSPQNMTKVMTFNEAKVLIDKYFNKKAKILYYITDKYYAMKADIKLTKDKTITYINIIVCNNNYTFEVSQNDRFHQYPYTMKENQMEDFNAGKFEEKLKYSRENKASVISMIY